MNRSFDRVITRCCLSFLLAAACTVQLATAQEELPPLPPMGGKVHFGEHPIFSKLPLAPDYLHRVLANDNGEVIIFLKKMPPAEAASSASCTNEGCEKLSTKIIAAPSQRDVEKHIEIFSARFLREGCAPVAAGECVCAAQESCPCAAEEKVNQCVAEGAKHAQLQFGLQCGSDCAETKCGEEACDGPKVLTRHIQPSDDSEEFNPLKLMQHIVGLVGEKSAAIAALEVRKQADEQIGELYEAMSELMADNAALDAKLEAAAEQRKLLEKVAELAAENARLKTHLELAAERAEVARQSAAIALENERLKLHIAAIEQKHAVSEAIRAAAKPKDHEAR